MTSPTIEDWLWVEVMLVQALIGAITPNFREVVLSYEDSEWVIVFTLEKESNEDREEIIEIVDEFSIYLEDIKSKISDVAYTHARASTYITSDKLDFKVSKARRVIFRRKEPGKGVST